MFGLVNRKQLNDVIEKLAESNRFREANEVIIKLQECNLLDARKQISDLSLENSNLHGNLLRRRNSLTDEIQELKANLIKGKEEKRNMELTIERFEVEIEKMTRERDASGRFVKKNRCVHR